MYKRYSTNTVIEALADTPVVYVMGPRQAGKTTLVKGIIDDEWTYITLDDEAQLEIANTDPIGFIRNMPKNKIVIDEVQRLPQLFVAIKQSVDEDRKPGRFLLTGSANALLLPKLSDSLAGRMEAVKLNPLSECELNAQPPKFLESILNGEVPATKEVRLKDYLLKRVIMGCFPEPVQRASEQRAQKWYQQYINAMIQRDIKDLSNIEHHDIMTKLLKISAYYAGKLIVLTELGAKVGLDRLTVKKYISLLEQLFLVQQLPAWHTNEYKRLIKTPKMHAIDTGMICAVRGLTAERLSKRPEEYGTMLESFVLNELLKQSIWLHEPVHFYHYRDKDKVECDIIIENAMGDCYGIEVKATASLSSKDFNRLKRFKDVAKDRFKLGILLYDGDHTTSFGDGLYAVPMGALWSN